MNKSISFVIPCLNEELTLPLVLTKLNHLKNNELKDRVVEIIVSDNGSTDRSLTIANEFGVKINHCPIRGYGAALNSGILSAKGEIIIFADADDTYDFLESPRLIKKLEEGYEFVIGF
jgi:glycosyltransferase involved in cell wall biosynthesis